MRVNAFLGVLLSLTSAYAADLVVSEPTTLSSGSYDSLVATADVGVPAGSTVVVTGAKTSYVAQGLANEVTLNVFGDLVFTGDVVDFGRSSLVVGYLGATGHVNVASGGSLRWEPAVTNTASYRWRFACNGPSAEERLLPSFVSVDLSGRLCAPYFEMGAFYPSNGTQVAAAELNLRPGGVLLASAIGVNDMAVAQVNCLGGTIRAGHALDEFKGSFVVGSGKMDIRIPEGGRLVFDSAGRDLQFNFNSGRRLLSGTGDLVKTGDGMLVVGLGYDNSFTGNVRVEQGALSLGRPLAEGQTVTVAEGASFLPWVEADLDHVVYEGTPAKSVYTVLQSVTSGGIDLLSHSELYYGDRLKGSLGGTVAVTGTVTHAELSAANPFQILGGGTLLLAGTGLVNEPLWFRSGDTSFAEDRQQGADGFLRIDDGATAEFSNFRLSDTTRPAVWSHTNGYMVVRQNLMVGTLGGTGVLEVANGTTLRCFSTVRLGSGSESAGRFPSKGTVTISNGMINAWSIDFSAWGLTNLTDHTTIWNELVLREAGTARAANITRHDDPAARVLFDGGKVQSNWGTHTNAFFVSGDRGRLYLEGSAGHDIRWDQDTFSNALFGGTGWLITQGACDFVRTGTGLLNLVNMANGHLVWGHTGATRFEGGGTIRAGADNMLPYGPGLGGVSVGAGVTFDLNGWTTTLNSLSCAGVLTNSAATAATLALGADDADVVFALSAKGSPVNLKKVGSGTMTLKMLPTGDLVVENGVARLPRLGEGGFRHYRFKMEKASGASRNSMQIAELKLLCDGADVTGLRSGFGYVPGPAGTDVAKSAYPSGEPPANALDGNLGTKYLDFRLSAARAATDGADIWLQIDYAAPQRVTHYTWATANDSGPGSTCRDLCDWRFLGSDDGETWYELDVVSGFTATSERKAWVGTNFVCSVDAPWVLPGALTVKPGARLDIAPGTHLVCASARTAGGTVNLGEGAVLEIRETGEGGIQGTTLSGAADFVKSGSGNLTVFGATDFAGRLNVAEGTLTGCSLPVTTNEWLRFTFKKAKRDWNGNWIVQLSELKLFDEVGNRVCMDLAEKAAGTAAASLAPGETALEQGGGTWYYSHEGPSKLFDGNTSTKICIVNSAMSDAADSSHWRSVVLRVKAGTPPIAGYGFISGGDTYGARNPSNWTVESSPDGVNWTLLDTRDDPVTPDANLAEFNAGVPYGFDWCRAPGGLAFTPDAVVSVAAGATLDLLGGTTEIGNLALDLTAGAGTVTVFNPAVGGSLLLANLPEGGSLKNRVLPISVSECLNRERLSGWKVYLDGTPVTGVRLVYADGGLALVPGGCTIFIR